MKRSDFAMILGLSAAFAGGLSLLDAARPLRDAATGARPTGRVAAVASAAQESDLSSRPEPVPLHFRHRVPFDSVTVEALIAAAAGPGDEAAAALPETVEPTDPDAEAARIAAEADGYRSVKVVKRGPDGTWRVSGLRGRTTVMLTVDANGSVSAD